MAAFMGYRWFYFRFCMSPVCVENCFRLYLMCRNCGFYRIASSVTGVFYVGLSEYLWLVYTFCVPFGRSRHVFHFMFVWLALFIISYVVYLFIGNLGERCCYGYNFQICLRCWKYRWRISFFVGCGTCSMWFSEISNVLLLWALFVLLQLL